MHGAEPEPEPETLEKDVERAIREARERVGNEFAELLEAPTMTRAEMDAIEGEKKTE